ncbi:hypothetical protein Leryth_008331 [Lithospermum erythrorhizon]|nr:hypothetical protein Leryth_008331 [Lithospermum erythrorhizon]
MCQNTTITACNSEPWRWNSPLPYLIGGLALLIGMITMALTALICSLRKNRLNSSSDDIEGGRGGGGNIMHIDNNMHADMDPKIAVIMAGDENPTCLAVPVIREDIFVEDGRLVDENEMSTKD